MASFHGVLRETGVDLGGAFMMAPLGKSALVRLIDAAGFELLHDPRQLDVLQVTRGLVPRVQHALADQFFKWGLLHGPTSDLARAYAYAAVANPENFISSSRLLLVTGKVRGVTRIEAVRGRLTQRLEVAVLPANHFTIAFKFLQHFDAAGATVTPTRWRPAEAADLIAQLNWVFGLQANVWFTLADADWVKVDRNLGQPLSPEEFLTYVAPKKDPCADLTVFLVGKWKGNSGHSSGTYYGGEPRAIAVDDFARTYSDADQFLTNLAHEVFHFLQDDHGDDLHHHGRQAVLLSERKQSTRLDRQLVLYLNPP